jgi:hypothetical protein
MGKQIIEKFEVKVCKFVFMLNYGDLWGRGSIGPLILNL